MWKSTSVSGALSHFAAMTRPCWLRRAVRNRHRHAIEQTSHQWRAGRRDDSAQRHRELLISTQAARRAERVVHGRGLWVNGAGALGRLGRRVVHDSQLGPMFVSAGSARRNELPSGPRSPRPERPRLRRLRPRPVSAYAVGAPHRVLPPQKETEEEDPDEGEGPASNSNCGLRA